MKKYSALLTMVVLLMSAFIGNAFADRQETQSHHKKSKYSLLSPKMEKTLDLTTDQQQAWENARTEIKARYETFRQSFKDERTKIKQVINQQMQSDNPSLEAIFDARKEMQEKLIELRSEIQTIEIGVYNQLNSEQKKLVLEKMQQHMDKKKDRRQQKQSSDTSDDMES